MKIEKYLIELHSSQSNWKGVNYDLCINKHPVVIVVMNKKFHIRAPHWQEQLQEQEQSQEQEQLQEREQWRSREA